MAERREWQAPCPTCGGVASFVVTKDGDEYHWCPACSEREGARMKVLRDGLRAKFPTLSPAMVNTLVRGYTMTFRELLGASDSDLLCVRNFGAGRLKEFRAVWPTPVADMASDDPWRDHAEMIAGVR